MDARWHEVKGGIDAGQANLTCAIGIFLAARVVAAAVVVTVVFFFHGGAASAGFC